MQQPPERSSYFRGIPKPDIFFQRNFCRYGPYERKLFHSERAPYGTNFSPYFRFRTAVKEIRVLVFLELVSLLGRQSGLRKTVDDPLDILLSLER